MLSEIEKLAVNIFTVGRDASNRFFYDAPIGSWTQQTESSRIGWRTIAWVVWNVASHKSKS